MPAQPALNRSGSTLWEVRPTRVLIVDDEPAIRQVLADILQGEGYLVSEAANGLQALGVVGRDRPDAIIADLMMPVMDGGTFVRQSVTRSIPKLLMSASPSLRQHAEQLRPFGVRGWIAKPFDLLRLLDSIAQLAEPTERLVAAR
jgi:two-component system response regulator MprA